MQSRRNLYSYSRSEGKQIFQIHSNLSNPYTLICVICTDLYFSARSAHFFSRLRREIFQIYSNFTNPIDFESPLARNYKKMYKKIVRKYFLPFFYPFFTISARRALHSLLFSDAAAVFPQINISVSIYLYVLPIGSEQQVQDMVAVELRHPIPTAAAILTALHLLVVVRVDSVDECPHSYLICHRNI